MEVLFSSLEFAFITVLQAVLGGYFVGSAVKHFKREEYLSFGGCVMLAISCATYIVKDIWFR